ncbi:tetratricopeptide repeat protein [candidate division KSB1 bacterium]|nr:tetratricopeptide repeat protein [candidate division KSB1 bacterium]NIS24078.1 tetratricopeptide repeat protein [candidate division KSB1 bacterium]NIU24699.1 tetratricopeptide repeat protein [candidate division KSB1 bacterium]NIU89215.1 tetratricopeptide repeat protein [candidate division KSB1 bacterium]NIW18553.1 tetratricopeptide repeat protein [candidate division KSB1 bacterium]
MKTNFRSIGQASLVFIVLVSSIYTGCTGGKKVIVLSQSKRLSILWEYGERYYQEEKYQQAIPLLKKVTELDKNRDYPNSYTYLARSYLQVGKIDSSQLTYKFGVDVYPTNRDLYLGLGQIFYIRQQPHRAISEYRKALALRGNALDVLKRLAELYLRTDQVTDALWAYEKIAALEPDNVEAREIVKVLRKRAIEVTLNLSALLKMLEIDPNNVELLLRAAKAARRAGEYESAIDFYRQLYSLIPESKQIVMALATCYYEAGQLSNARNFAQKAAKLELQYGDAFVLIGKVYEKAVSFCQKESGRSANKLSYYDKLVYKKANEAYKMALDDPKARKEAQRRMSLIKDKLPTQEDDFLHSDKQISDRLCYSWMES